MIQRQKNNGFTLVELLIAIVVIGILAAITAFAFNGIQQRARNAQRISDAGSVSKLILVYRGAKDVLPYNTNASVICPATFSAGCYYTKGAAPPVTLNDVATKVSEFGTPPKIDSIAMSVPLSATASAVGPIYQYRANASLDGTTQTFATILYWLEGANQNCSQSSGRLIVSTTAGSYNPPYITSPNPYTYGNLNSNTVTACLVAL